MLGTLHTWEPDILAELLRQETSRRVFCYLMGPPISEDDLKTLAETTLAPRRIAAKKDEAGRLRDIAFKLLDPRRFAWIAQRRTPIEGEIEAAIIATAALIANTKVQTGRRTGAMRHQERIVKDLLLKMGFEEIRARPILSSAFGPKPKQFMGEAAVVGAKGDVIAGLSDGRILIVECKVSNSAINSRKRLVHDTGGKATIWYDNAGRSNIVVTAVLSGVYGVSDLQHAQSDQGVYLFWDHRLSDLTDFILRVESAAAR